MSALRVRLRPGLAHSPSFLLPCAHPAPRPWLRLSNCRTSHQARPQDASAEDSARLERQLSTPPVLFIKKYQVYIDTQELEVRDELSDLAKRGQMTPQSLTQQKVQYIVDAVRQTQTMEKLAERLRRQPEPLQAPATTTAKAERSVFVDSDFEVIRPAERPEEGRLNIMKYETELEWKQMRLDLRQLGGHYLMLSKSRLTLLVCLTAAAGYGMAPGPLSLSTCLLASLGTAMASAAANTINQILEVPFDSQMSRTKNRVLVRGHLSTLHAATFAAVMAGTSTLFLYTLVNPLTACLSFLNLVLYTSVYTPMKRYSIANTWVGSVVGAVPPLIGWSAATGSLEPGAFVLAGILFAWQFPHFNSLSWNLRPDYSKAGYRMMSVTHPALCKRVALRHSLGCIAVCTAAPLLDVTTWAFAIDSLPLNLYMTFLSWKFYKKADSSSSRQLFRFTLIHLPLLMMLMCISKKSDKDKDRDKDSKDLAE
jgi:protoheme IX farnesyltransferase